MTATPPSGASTPRPSLRSAPTRHVTGWHRRRTTGSTSSASCRSAVGENFARLFEAAAQRWPDACALVWEGGRVSYRRLDRQANAVAAFLARHGVVPGDRVALAIPNRWPFVPALLGALKLGVTVAPLDPLLSAAERQRVVDDLAPRVIVHHVLGDETDWNTQDDPPAPALVLYTSGSTGAPKGAMLSHRAL